MGKMKRRRFIFQAAALSLGSTIPVACLHRERNDASVDEPPGTGGGNGLVKNREMPAALVMQLLDQKVDHFMEVSNNCAQSSFLALTEQFELGGEEVLKALTPLPGIAERGETCGAVTGCLMAFGLIYGRGRNRLHDWDVYRDSLVPAGEFCRRFEKAFGSTMCSDIQEAKFGRSFQLTDPEDLRAFQEAGATAGCSAVVRRAVRMAAEIILTDPHASHDK
jgi:C_GCAxxG_C_C family probable redox protein